MGARVMCFRLFEEWRGISLYGISFESALLRQRLLQRQGDRDPETGEFVPGRIYSVKQVIPGTGQVVPNSLRGNREYYTAMIVTSDDELLRIDYCAEPTEFEY